MENNNEAEIDGEVGRRVPQAFIDYIRRARERMGWSQRELARRSGFSQTVVWRMERGESLPDSASVRAMAEVLGLDEVHLLRLAGHIEATPSRHRDPRAEWFAEKVNDLIHVLPLPVTRRMLILLRTVTDSYDEIAVLLNELSGALDDDANEIIERLVAETQAESPDPQMTEDESDGIAATGGC